MNLIDRLLGRPGGRNTPLSDAQTLRIEKALDSRLRKLRSEDPQTGRQWNLLREALRQGEVRRPAAATIRRLRPAFALGLLAIGLVLVFQMRERPVSTVAHSTGRGQHSTITLADSSEITLNHTSELSVDGTSNEASRRVTLEGEAFFRVRTSGSPFVVTTDVGTVRVLGTEFNVRVRGEKLEVAVIRGSVRVAADSAGLERAVVLRAGELTTCYRGSAPEQPGPLRYAEYPGWLHGKLLFDRATMEEACREIQNHFDVAVKPASLQPDAATITGAIDARNPEAAVATIARLTGRQYRHDPSGYTIY